MAQQLIKKFQDRVGRIIRVFKDTKTRQYTIEESLYDTSGNSMLTDHRGCAVAMISYTFNNRTACFNVLRDKYKRETRFA